MLYNKRLLNYIQSNTCPNMLITLLSATMESNLSQIRICLLKGKAGGSYRVMQEKCEVDVLFYNDYA